MQDKDGVKRYTTEIIANQMQMLGSRQGMGGGASADSEGGSASSGGGSRPASKPAAAKAGGGKFDDMEDDIPF